MILKDKRSLITEHCDLRQELLSIISRKSFVVEMKNLPYRYSWAICRPMILFLFDLIFPLKCHRHSSFAWGRIVSRFIRLKFPFPAFCKPRWSSVRLLKLSVCTFYILYQPVSYMLHITASSKLECIYPISHIRFTIFTIGYITDSSAIKYHICITQVPRNY